MGEGVKVCVRVCRFFGMQTYGWAGGGEEEGRRGRKEIDTCVCVFVCACVCCCVCVCVHVCVCVCV